MNELGVTLIWLAGQVTAVCIVVMLMSFCLRRRPPLSASATLAGTLLVSLMTAVIFSPWPRWSWPVEMGSADVSVQHVAAPISSAATTAMDSKDVEAPLDGNSTTLVSTTAAAWNAFIGTLGRVPPPASESEQPAELRWTGWLAIGLLFMMAFGLARLLIGWLSVRQCIRRSRKVLDPELRQLLDVLQAESCCVRRVELRISSEIHTAATIGWRNPVILLPDACRDWTTSERRMVLAHELAHVVSGDSLTWLVAQLGLVFHSYHPCVHWLVRRLRLEQELAADAVAAQTSGGPRRYLETLAGLAVRQPQRALAWPVRAFLPERGTLMRRIEMLRDARGTLTPAPAWRKRILIVATVFVGLLISGIRRPLSEEAVAAATVERGPVAPAAGFDLSNVPSSAVLVMAAQPSRLADRAEFAPLRDFANDAMSADKVGFGMSDIQQVLVIGVLEPSSPRNAMRPPVIEIRLNRAQDFSAFATVQIGGAIKQSIDGMTVLAASDIAESPDQEVIRILDDRTAMQGRLSHLRQMANAAGQPAWLENWTVSENSHVGLALNMESPRAEMQASFQRNPNPLMGMFAPLWQETDVVMADLALEEGVALTVRGVAGNEESAEKIAQTLNAIIPVGQGLILGSRSSAEKSPEEYRAVLMQALEMGNAALKSAKVQRDGNDVVLTASAGSGQLGAMAAMLLPAVQSARTAAKRAQATNNMKQIMLALHNYHDTFGSFPPSVLLGPDGKTKYSWRVAILPFVEHAELYEKYRRNEPWDSPHNKALLSEMPPVFRNPNDSTASTSTSYFGFVGNQTAFGDSPGEGNNIRSFLDGTSNTIMVVETKREVPWSKPEDISYSDSDEIAELGGWFDGGFIAGLADGSARFFSESLMEKTLRNLIKRDDRQVVEF